VLKHEVLNDYSFLFSDRGNSYFFYLAELVNKEEAKGEEWDGRINAMRNRIDKALKLLKTELGSETKELREKTEKIEKMQEEIKEQQKKQDEKLEKMIKRNSVCKANEEHLREQHALAKQERAQDAVL